jgi:hypothetical protein
MVFFNLVHSFAFIVIFWKKSIFRKQFCDNSKSLVLASVWILYDYCTMIWLFTFVCIVLRWYGNVLFSEMKTNAFLYCKRCKLQELIFFNVFYCSTICRCPSQHIFLPGLYFFYYFSATKKGRDKLKDTYHFRL